CASRGITRMITFTIDW
nr:immunoglobulin heavy chain junction region [Macaca mulatta]